MLSATVVLEKTLESPLDFKEIKPVHPKGNKFWIFIGGTDAEAEAPIVWPPDAKSWLIRKDPDAGKDWRQERRGWQRMRWDGWMASPSKWTWVWASSRRWWRTGKPGVLQPMGSQRVRHDWVTEKQTSKCGAAGWTGDWKLLSLEPLKAESSSPPPLGDPMGMFDGRVFKSQVIREK